MIPRAKGGRRKDVGIIVPACARCNHHRGCREFVLFLLARPRRISSFLAYLDTLPSECLGQVDPRIIAELYVAISLLSESTRWGDGWKERLQRLCSGRRLHRRRYVARRLVGTVTERLERLRRRTRHPAGPSCLIPAPSAPVEALPVEDSLEELRAALVTVLARMAETPAEWVLHEILQALRRGRAVDSEGVTVQSRDTESMDTSQAFTVSPEIRSGAAGGEEVVSLGRWNRRRQRWRRSRLGHRGRQVRGYAA